MNTRIRNSSKLGKSIREIVLTAGAAAAIICGTLAAFVAYAKYTSSRSHSEITEVSKEPVVVAQTSKSPTPFNARVLAKFNESINDSSGAPEIE